MRPAPTVTALFTGDPVWIDRSMPSPTDLLARLGLATLEKPGVLTVTPRVALVHGLAPERAALALHWVRLPEASDLGTAAGAFDVAVVLSGSLADASRAIVPPTAQAPARPDRLPDGGRADHADRGTVLVEHGHHRRVRDDAASERFRAVDGIEPPAPGVPALPLAELLADDAVLGHRQLEAGTDQLLGAAVGGGDGRLVALRDDREVGVLEVAQRQLAGLAGQGDGEVEAGAEAGRVVGSHALL